MTNGKFTRRGTVVLGAILGAAVVSRGRVASPAVAAPLEPTPEAWEGPWYPVDWHAPVGNDLTAVVGRPPPEGRAMLFGGIVRDTAGALVQGITVQMWHVNIYGRYAHPEAQNGTRDDPGFRGYGDAVTGEDGRFLFRTIEPRDYSRRGPLVSGDFAPHIHMRLWRAGTLLRTVRADFVPRPGAPPGTGPQNEAGPGSARWLGAGETAGLLTGSKLRPADAAAAFDIVLPLA